MPVNGSEGGLVVPRPPMDGGPSADSNASASINGANVNGSWKLSSKRSNLSTHSASAMSPLPSGTTLVNGGNGAADNGTMFPELDGKEAAEQLDILKDMLKTTTQVREAAETVLKRELTGAGRSRLELAVGQSTAKIDAIMRKIESLSSRVVRKAPSSGPSKLSPIVIKRRLTEDANGAADQEAVEKDDIRSAKQQVLALVRTLLSYARQHINLSAVPATSSSLGAPLPTTREEIDKARLETMKRLSTILHTNARLRLELNMDDLFQAVSPFLSDISSTKGRSAAYRVLRYTLVDRDSVDRLLEQNLDWYIVRSLLRDNKCAAEREQAIKLIRTIVEIGSERRVPHSTAGLGKVPLSEAVMRAVIAVAEHPEDPFNLISCQTLLEILLIDIELVTKCGGMRVLLQALVDGPAELAPIMASAFLYIIDVPQTREYLNPGTDLEIALSGVTDAYGKGTSHADRMRISAKVISVLLRTWSGLMYLCMNDMAAIRSMIDTIRIPSLETREIVLDMFFDLLNIQTPEWYRTFIEGKRLTIYRRRPTSQPTQERPTMNTKSPVKFRLVDQYISLLLIILTKAGLLEALTSMLEETTTSSSLSRKATLLIAEILQLASKTLPMQCAAGIQNITRIFDLAADYVNGKNRIVGTGALSAIESFNRHQARSKPTPEVDSRRRANSVEDPVRRGQRQVEQSRMKIAMQMDDRTFQTALVDTQVMMSKDFTKWNYETLLEIVEGPLLNPKRLEEALKGTRFVKRLMSFFHPFSQSSHRFADIKKSKPNLKWVKLGCTLLSTLLASVEGVKYLATEDEFLPQIVKGFGQLEPQNRQTESETVFSKKKVEESLTYGYLEMLGTLSRQKEGIELLEKFKIFSALYLVSDLKSRDDLVKAIIQNIDYSIDGHARIVLSKALTSAYKHIREFATVHLGQLIQSSSKVNTWMLRLLVTQLYDPDNNVCEKAVRYLEEACDSSEILKVVVDMQPTLEHLGDIANSLLYKFMSTPLGFRYLYDVGFIDREMDAWLYERNENYVIEIEVYLSRELNFNPMEDDEDKSLDFDGTAPRHFYGELAKTDFGCQVLEEKGHFTDFADFIEIHGLENVDCEIIHRLKSVLWAVGNIAASPGGLRFLEEENIIPVLLKIAEESTVLSVRGCCFFALGLVSTTTQGAEVLDDYGWECTLTHLGLPTGLCYPSDIEKFVAVESWSPPSSLEKPRGLIPPISQEEVDVITAIGKLANTVIANASSRTLAKMKSKPEFRSTFSSPSVFYRVLRMISTQRFRLPVRRYILDLFDIQLDAGVVKQLSECAEALIDTGNLSSPKIVKLQPRAVSMFGRPGRNRIPSDSSDDESMDSEEEREGVVQRPVSLLPAKRVVGFLDSPIMSEL